MNATNCDVFYSSVYVIAKKFSPLSIYPTAYSCDGLAHFWQHDVPMMSWRHSQPLKMTSTFGSRLAALSPLEEIQMHDNVICLYICLSASMHVCASICMWVCVCLHMSDTIHADALYISIHATDI